MNKRQTALSMGYLVKSPTKGKDKSSLPMFWKLRWCVFAKICYSHKYGGILGTKLVLYYYENKQAYKDDVPAKGCLNITSCTSIKSCYKSAAGFDHIFKVSWSDGNYVKFSAQSCQKKFKWITSLYNYKFNTNIRGVTRSRVITGQNRGRKTSSPISTRRETSQSSSSGGSEKSEQDSQRSQVPINRDNHKAKFTSPVQPSKTGFHQRSIRSDSGRFSMSTINSFVDPCSNSSSLFGESDDKFPEIRSTRSGSTQVADDTSFVSPDAKLMQGAPLTLTKEQQSTQQSSLFHHLFILCERCQDSGKSKNGLIRKLSYRKRDGLSNDEPLDIDVHIGCCGNSSQCDGNITQDRLYTDVLQGKDEEEEGLYIEIDDDWLKRVQQLMGDYVEDDEFEDDPLNCYPDDEIYMKMDIFTLADNGDQNNSQLLHRADACKDDVIKSDRTLEILDTPL